MDGFMVFFMFVFMVGFAFYFGTQLVAGQMIEDQSGEVDQSSAMMVQRVGSWLVFLSGAVLALMFVRKMMGKDTAKETSAMVAPMIAFGKRRRR